MARRRTDPGEREVLVPKGANGVVVRARDHEWVALAQDGAELVREHSGARETTFTAEPGAYSVLTDGSVDSVEPLSLDFPDLFGAGERAVLLRLSADAPDRHLVDGVGEIAADGESATTITIEKVDAVGEPMERRRDNDEIFVRTTGGTILDAKRDHRIRSVKLRSGRASFRLVAEETPRLVTVSALAAGVPTAAEIQVEFV